MITKYFSVLFTIGIFSISSTSLFAEYDSKQKEMMNKEAGELSSSNKNVTSDKQGETTGTDKVQQKLHDREDASHTSESDKHRDQDRAGKTVEEKRDIHSDGPRADGGEDTHLETQKTPALK